VKITEKFEELRDIFKSPQEAQTRINVAEVWHLWNLLQARYDVVETTDVLINFVEDTDLLLILNSGKKILQKQIDFLEIYIDKQGIPLPPPTSKILFSPGYSRGYNRQVYLQAGFKRHPDFLACPHAGLYPNHFFHSERKD